MGLLYLKKYLPRSYELSSPILGAFALGCVTQEKYKRVFVSNRQQCTLHLNSQCRAAFITPGMRVSPINIPKMSVKVTGCPADFFFQSAFT